MLGHEAPGRISGEGLGLRLGLYFQGSKVWTGESTVGHASLWDLGLLGLLGALALASCGTACFRLTEATSASSY